MLDLAKANFGHRSGDFPGDKSFAPPGAFMVEQDTIASKHVVGFPEVHHTPVGKELGHTIR